MTEAWRRLLLWLRLRRPRREQDALLARHDYRLDELERDLSETEARVKLLEYEADIRGERRDG